MQVKLALSLDHRVEDGIHAAAVSLDRVVGCFGDEAAYAWSLSSRGDVGDSLACVGVDVDAHVRADGRATHIGGQRGSGVIYDSCRGLAFGVLIRSGMTPERRFGTHLRKSLWMARACFRIVVSFL